MVLLGILKSSQSNQQTQIAIPNVIRKFLVKRAPLHTTYTVCPFEHSLKKKTNPILRTTEIGLKLFFWLLKKSNSLQKNLSWTFWKCAEKMFPLLFSEAYHLWWTCEAVRHIKSIVHKIWSFLGPCLDAFLYLKFKLQESCQRSVHFKMSFWCQRLDQNTNKEFDKFLP